MKIAKTALLGALALAGPALAQSGDPSGVWLSQSGETRVKIARCGSVYCGTIVASKQEKDTNNPDPAKRHQSLVGVRMITDIAPSGGGFSGQLYNFQDGKTYTGKLKLVGPKALELSGCVLGGLFCRSQPWSRVN
jgi:uncharacterized protein (DUF2147 family)